MNDIEEAISYIESTKKHLLHLGETWYADYLDDAIELLKEQEKDRLEIAHEMVSGSILMYRGKELVRCRDCKHWKNRKNAKGENMIDCLLADNWLKYPDWFCADGERRTYE